MFKSIAAVALLATGAVAIAADNPHEQKVRDSIKDLVQNAQVDSVRPSALPGFQEVVLGGQLLYVSNDGKYLLSGALWDVAAKKNLTEEGLGGLRMAALKSVGDDKRIVYKAKEPKHTITVFTDIDCGYCRKLHQQMADYNKAGITVEYLFFPRMGPGSEGFEQAVAVACAADKRGALTRSKAGTKLPHANCKNSVAADYALGQRVGVDGTPAIYAEDGQQIGGYLPPAEMVKALDELKAPGAP